jgi:hypothetical protein
MKRIIPIGTRVRVTADNFGTHGRVENWREQEPCYLVGRDGGMYWYFTYEVEEAEDDTRTLRQPA